MLPPEPLDAPTEAEDADDAPAGDPEPEPAKAGIGLQSALKALTHAQHVALMRAGWTEEDIAEAPSAEWLQRHADREAAIEARNKAAYEATKQTKPEGRTKRQGAQAPKQTEAEPAVSPSAEPVYDALPEPVRDELGLSDKATKALERYLAQKNEALDRRAAELEETIQQRLAQADNAAVQRDIRDIRAELQADRPELAAPAIWEKVLKHAQATSGGYEHIEDKTAARRLCLKHAALAVLDDSPAEKKQAKAPPKAPTLTRPGPKPAPRTRKLSPQEQALKNAREAAAKHGLDDAGHRRRW